MAQRKERILSNVSFGDGLELTVHRRGITAFGGANGVGVEPIEISWEQLEELRAEVNEVGTDAVKTYWIGR